MTNRAGQSLVAVLISVGIMGIIASSMASLFVFQYRETHALSEKLGSADLEKTLISALADGSVCQYVLNNPTVLTFDTTKVSSTTPQTINLTGPLYASINPGPPQTPGPVVAKIGQAESGYATTLVVNSIQLLITSGSGNTYVGNWSVGFDNTKTVRALKPISVSTIITVSTTAPHTPTAAAITNCQNSPAGGSGVPDVQTFNANGTWTKPASGSTVTIECWGGGQGGGCNGGTGGSYIVATFAISALGATEAVTIGAGGSAGPSAPYLPQQNSGGNSTVYRVIAYGGGNGPGGTESGGLGGTGAGGGAPMIGGSTSCAGAGGGGCGQPGTGYGTGIGGTSGCGGNGGNGVISGAAGPGIAPGGGGGGGWFSGSTSGAGAHGRCVITTI